MEWRKANAITDPEFAAIGKLLCDHTARDLALLIVRLGGQMEVAKMMHRTDYESAQRDMRHRAWEAVPTWQENAIVEKTRTAIQALKVIPLLTRAGES